MSISKMVSAVSRRRKYLKPLTSEETTKLVEKLIPIIAPEQHEADNALLRRVSYLPMTDLIAEENPSLWN